MEKHLCPYWAGFLLINPFRRIPHNPNKILGHHVREGMIVLDLGPGMGFFSLPMARMVGERGKVICVDVQERMVRALAQRARKAGLSDWIEVRLCSETSLGIDDLSGKIDFVLCFAILHEVSDKEHFLAQVHVTMKSESTILIAEPKIHVKKKEFDDSIAVALRSGFKVIDYPSIPRTYAALLMKRVRNHHEE